MTNAYQEIIPTLSTGIYHLLSFQEGEKKNNAVGRSTYNARTNVFHCRYFTVFSSFVSCNAIVALTSLAVDVFCENGELERRSMLSVDAEVPGHPAHPVLKIDDSILIGQ